MLKEYLTSHGSLIFLLFNLIQLNEIHTGKSVDLFPNRTTAELDLTKCIQVKLIT